MARELGLCGLPEMCQRFFAQLHPATKLYLGRFGFPNALTGSVPTWFR